MAEGVRSDEEYSGTKPVEERHRIDEARLHGWMEQHVEGFRGPLTVLQFKGGQRPPISLDIGFHPAVETGLVDPMPLLDRLGAGKFLVASDAFGHRNAPRILRPSRGAPDGNSP